MAETIDIDLLGRIVSGSLGISPNLEIAPNSEISRSVMLGNVSFLRFQLLLTLPWAVLTEGSLKVNFYPSVLNPLTLTEKLLL